MTTASTLANQHRVVSREEWLVSVDIGGCFGRVPCFQEIDQYRIEATPLSIIEIAIDVLIPKLCNQRPRAVSVDQERTASRIDEMSTPDAQWVRRTAPAGGAVGSGRRARRGRGLRCARCTATGRHPGQRDDDRHPRA